MAKCHFAIWTPITGGSGGHLGGPFKIVHHTTEIATARATLKSYKRNRTDPHFTVDDKDIYQHVDTKYGARSLKNRPGGVQTNRDSAIQIEVVGYAAKPKDPDTLENVARLCRWIEQEHEVPRVWPNGFPKAARRGHDPGDHNRDKKNWDQKAGHYGHCHVPENSHWDPAYTHKELMTIMDGVLSTGDGDGAPSALAPGFGAQAIELAIGEAAGGELALTNRIVEVTLGAQGFGTSPIDVAWERVLSVTPYVTKKPSDRPVGEISLGEVDGRSVVALSRGTAHARVQVLIKTLDETKESDTELAASCPGDDDGDAWQGNLVHHFPQHVEPGTAPQAEPDPSDVPPYLLSPFGPDEVPREPDEVPREPDEETGDDARFALAARAARSTRAVHTQLSDGDGLYGYYAASRRWGTDSTIRALEEVGRIWTKRRDASGTPRIGVGDISLRGGGDISGHASHETGRDVDLRPLRNNGTEGKVTYKQAQYSRELTQEFIDLLYVNGVVQIKLLLFNDPECFGCSYWDHHDNHLHVRFHFEDIRSGFPLVTLGMDNSPAVRELQRRLNNRRASMGSATLLTVDGDFGQRTYDAVVAFQSDHLLSPDGKAGKDSWTATLDYLV